jgi:hypothetical protein
MIGPNVIPQVVVLATIEIDGIAKLQPQPDGTQSCFCTAGRIECPVKTGSTDAKGRTHNAAVRKQARAEPEIDEPSLKRDERTKMTASRLE